MSRALLSGALYAAIVFAAGFLLGGLRFFVLMMVDSLSLVTAVLIELPIILLFAWFVCGWILRRLLPSSRWIDRLCMAAASFVCMVGAEAALSMLLGGWSFDEHIAAYQSLDRALGLFGQAIFACFPLMRHQRGLRRTGHQV